ncbi:MULTISPECIES: Xaa-Pro peptidase family protein [Thermoactinomyces]|uniref:M24 family metallopeptidase n=1 Tax=Thermoactinomyces daqus TaxID=1329516 RepID=A0A7W2AK29_9BACL|nr:MULTISPECIES: M24 family metallopeptidase [Thermoactinomyces]MBA4544424.1 M24 family metallopeptidase [Thermoactinomyces daqus]MBH8598199.1 M24 family metallopeptidase [Thermoactinomyces sp. CICC 10523]MBH8603228.1 M24 family metallopeptidase [Thermoactinomyces sp. CICC 10522]MBH8608616.1 M24 family metallopeptidase [Thermoactinomyces sp. CICC 10521]
MGDISVNTALERVRTFMDDKKLDGVLFRRRDFFSWLTGGKDNHIVNTTELGVAPLLILRDRKICLASKMEAARIREEELYGQGYDWITPEWYEGEIETIQRICAGKRIGSDTPIDGLLYVEEELRALRYVLTESEIEDYRSLSQLAARAVESACRELVPGQSEHEIAANLAYKVLKEGMNPQVILVATDERIFRYRHPIPTDKKLERYAMLVLCAEKGGLVSNVTRFVHFGPLSPELEENKRKLAQIDAAMNAATRPGTPICKVIETGIEMYVRMGFPEDWKLLHQGGPTGYASREFLATPDAKGRVLLHQAFAWNPAIRGIKSEDTILVKEHENEFLTHTGEWVYLEVKHDGKTYLRPDILVRS